jgi:D-alanine-D-alanine ligase
MSDNRKVVILYNKIQENPTEDELDVLEQAGLVEENLTQLGYEPVRMTFSLDLIEFITSIKNVNPVFIFNLVESVAGRNELMSLAPMMLNYLNIPFTGGSFETFVLTTNKLLAKKILKNVGIPTPAWFLLDEIKRLEPEKKYILKPICEDGSIKLDEDSVFSGKDQNFIEKIKKLSKKEFFVEEYIDGREFNMSVLGKKEGHEVLPPAEILFVGYPEDKPKVVGYKAKWVEDSYEYDNTPRTFEFTEEDLPLQNELRIIADKCWVEFGLKGWSRIDLRIDKNNKPYVMEINSNPCIGLNSGFTNTAKRAGYDYKAMLEKIIEDMYV